ncbi:MAG: hypothetical protein QUS11_07965 [Candidatus Fermentibacter sp.]|nr:hypothetical protein [Candidatus Fermentibacter sp.]
MVLTWVSLACGGTTLLDGPVYTCPTAIPPTVLPGTPPPPLPTPYVITPPQDFFRDDPVIVGAAGAPLRVQFRLLTVQSLPASPDKHGQPRRIYSWQLEVHNLGSQPYETFPALQMFLSTLTTPGGDLTGVWPSSQAAAHEAGLTIDPNLYTLPPGQMRVFRFAAYAPPGLAHRFTFALDPTVTAGSPQVTWVNQPNPFC